MSKKFTKYAWNKNSGYGTKQHLSAIEKFGVTKHLKLFHRLTFGITNKGKESGFTKPFKKTRYMIFTPFDLDFNYLADHKPPADNGYYFTFVTYENRFIKSFFHYNGFVETDNAKATLIWNCGVVKNEIYQ